MRANLNEHSEEIQKKFYCSFFAEKINFFYWINGSDFSSLFFTFIFKFLNPVTKRC